MSREQSREDINDFLSGPGGWILLGVAVLFIGFFAFEVGSQTAGDLGGWVAVILVAVAAGGVYWWRVASS